MICRNKTNLVVGTITQRSRNLEDWFKDHAANAEGSYISTEIYIFLSRQNTANQRVKCS